MTQQSLSVEFARIIKLEYDKVNRRNFKFAEKNAMIKRRLNASRCNLIANFCNLFRKTKPDSSSLKDKSNDEYQTSVMRLNTK